MKYKRKTDTQELLHLFGMLLLSMAALASIGFCIVFYHPFVNIHDSPRSTEFRAQADIRMLATRIEEYKSYHDAFPRELWQLTSPIAYSSVIPSDIFSGDQEQSFNYYTDGEGYIIISRGPDLEFQIDPLHDFRFFENHMKIVPALIDKRYDATNGITSAGDIFRFGPDNYIQQR